MIITDCHVHSCFSSDSETPVEAMIQEAIKRNFPYFYLTDHMDYEFPIYEAGMDFLFDPNEYFTVLNTLKTKYSRQIEIRPSIELGLKPHLGDAYRKLLQNYPFEFVIGSTHLVDDLDPFNDTYWEGRSEKASLERYFETAIENIKSFPEMNTCGHLDYAIRYAPSVKKATLKMNERSAKGLKTSLSDADYKDCLVHYQYKDFADYLDETLKLLIHNGIALEVNTAGYAKGLGQPNPKSEVLQRYKELGGELLTIGSDGHVPEYYAYGFKKAEELLKKLGFKYYTVFKNRTGEMIKF